MAAESDLLLGLEFLTEGQAAQIPRALSHEVFSTERFMAETQTLKKKARPWTQGAGIQGLGIGDKIVDGKVEPELALRVYVERKKAKAKLKNPVPKSVSVPEVGKLPTDVLEIGRVEREVFTSRVRPAMPGCGVGHYRVTVGTLGCLVRKCSAKRGTFFLSNSHVLADEGTGKKGDDILQPGHFDGGRRPADVLGKLEAWVPFTFSATGYPNLVDAAIARVRKSSVTDVIRIIGTKPVGVSKTVRRGMRVQKVGRTTDYTIGVISDIHYRLALTYKKPGGGSGRVGLRDQVLCTRYTAGGDSGSAVLNMSERVVGLHFAGSPSTSIFNKITNVLNLLDIEVV